jgi:hypothetical protein
MIGIVALCGSAGAGREETATRLVVSLRKHTAVALRRGPGVGNGWRAGDVLLRHLGHAAPIATSPYSARPPGRITGRG